MNILEKLYPVEVEINKNRLSHQKIERDSLKFLGIY